jgi:predicted adenylyl cyclase CyaB
MNHYRHTMKNSYEIEIKSLLGSRENVLKLKKDLKKMFPGIKLIAEGKQLNHYFNNPPDFLNLEKKLEALVSEDKRAMLSDILGHGKKISIRTRDADGKVILVIKASVGDDTSANGVKRMEFESLVNKTLGELDKILLDTGCTYQAKWSRERQEYGEGDMHICLDKNAGYGYLAEFEKIASDGQDLDAVKSELLSIMGKLGVSELPQDRLERMFAHYNSHWMDYYGTDKTFTIK